MLSKRRGIKSLILFCTLILLLSSTQILVSFDLAGEQSTNRIETPAGHITHGPIAIDGDADFTSQATSETWSGSGTLGDPYRIENYYIDASTGHGINIANTQVHFVIDNCTIFGGATTYAGIILDKASNGTIFENEIYDVTTGIHLYDSDSNTIENNNISSCMKGIYVTSSDYVTAHNNTCSDNSDYDISVYDLCRAPIVTNNTCTTGGELNIQFYEAANVTFSHNRMYGKGVAVEAQFSDWLGFIEFTDNSVNGTPVLFLQDQVGGDYSGNYAQIILVRCENVRVKDMVLNDTHYGVSVLYCNDTVVKNVTAIRCYIGIDITAGYRVTVSDCNVSYNTQMGLMIDWGYPQDEPNSHLITNSTFSYNGYRAMLIGGEGGTTIFNNTCHDNSEAGQSYDQIFVMSTYDITIANNTCWGASASAANIYCAATDSLIANNTCINSDGYGIELDGADRSVVQDNFCKGNSVGIWIHDTTLSDITNNTAIENSPGIYCTGTSIYNTISYNNCSENFGAGISISAEKTLVWMNDCLNNTQFGISLYNVDTINTIANNTLSGNILAAIDTIKAERVIIANNTCRYSVAGIDLDSQSYNNSVYWNLFIDNTQNAVDVGEDNYITNNYWSDYVGVDTTPADGIGDTPHPISGSASNEDPYPWMNANFIPLLSSWVTTPVDQYVEYNNGFYLDLDTTAPEPMVMWINDTVQFSIDSSWVITNITPIDIGIYGLRVTGRNMYGHHLVAEFDVIVQDTTAPEWVSVPTDIMVIDMTESFSFDLEATDLSGIHHYWITSNANLTVDGDGLIGEDELVSDLSRGNYSVEVRAYDPYDNYASKVFTLSLVDMDSPTIDEPDDVHTTTDEGFVINWYPIDVHPWKYEIYRDDVLFDSGAWTVSSQNINVNLLEDTPGYYNFTIVVYDLDSNIATDTVMVRVVPGEPTTTTEPTDTTIPPPPTDDILILIISYGAVAVIVILVVVVLKKRR